MKRGERAMWRKFDVAVGNLIASQNYAEEYVARVEIQRIATELLNRSYQNITTLGVFDKLEEIHRWKKEK